ncbi:DUF6357 family protein [Streptomyces sp. NPDC091271]|uniref:DUF6357 family protein n=1 Tax=Streptomyces sp. NPDC091271 TaxID=3365980 RepID=UPI0038034802
MSAAASASAEAAKSWNAVSCAPPAKATNASSRATHQTARHPSQTLSDFPTTVVEFRLYVSLDHDAPVRQSEDRGSDPEDRVEYHLADGIGGHQDLASAFIRGSCAALEQDGSWMPDAAEFERARRRRATPSNPPMFALPGAPSTGNPSGSGCSPPPPNSYSPGAAAGSAYRPAAPEPVWDFVSASSSPGADTSADSSISGFPT